MDYVQVFILLYSNSRYLHGSLSSASLPLPLCVSFHHPADRPFRFLPKSSFGHSCWFPVWLGLVGMSYTLLVLSYVLLEFSVHSRQSTHHRTCPFSPVPSPLLSERC